MCCHNHTTCAKIRKEGGRGGVAIALLRKQDDEEWTVLLGKERKGQYKGQYNLCAGKRDRRDGKCFLQTAARELCEEFKLAIFLENGTFETIFKGNDGKIRYFMHQNTPIFVGSCGKLPLNELNPIIQQYNSIEDFPNSLKEIERVDWFRLSDRLPIENNPAMKVSSFANSVIKRINMSLINWHMQQIERSN